MTIYGWDMSHYDAPSIGDAVDEGISFITHKAGGDANDIEIGPWWAGVKSLGSNVLLGAYWVLYPGNPSGRADAFLARLNATCPGWTARPFILQVDCERWGGDQDTVPSEAEIKAFCDRLVVKAPKLRPIVYAPKWVYGDSLTGLPYPLWASSYVTGSGGFKSLYPGDSSSRWNAYSGQVPEILQYSSSATIGGQTTCDANAFRGTLAELTALLAPGWDIDMPLTPADAQLVWDTDTIPNPPQRADSETNPSTQADFAIGDIWKLAYNQRDALAALKVQVAALGSSLSAAIDALAGMDTVDEVALGQALAPAVAAAVLAALPEDTDDISQAEVTTAVEAAFANAFGSLQQP